MIVYKFLRRGQLGPFTAFQWDAGEWVTAEAVPLLCDRGIHGCRLADLPFWINRELWEI